MSASPEASSARQKTAAKAAGGPVSGPRVAAILVAAGVGSRAATPAATPGETAPAKQYRPIGGRDATARSLAALARAPRVARIVPVIRPEHDGAFARSLESVAPEARAKIAAPVLGGPERSDSVAAALAALAADPPEIVVIHDAARPFLPATVIERLLDALDDPAVDGACAALPVVDTLRRGGPDGRCGEILPRDGLFRAQTPQAFRYDALVAANAAGFAAGATDDAEIARRAGLRVALTPGAAELRKITLPEDFAWAEAWARLSDQEEAPPVMEPRIGTGFDVHKFGPSADGARDHVMLCGVRVPHDDGLVGHSDADVGLHALTDALLGALGLGDIGAHFPPSDPQWRGAASDRFLAHAAALARAQGARITQLDVTLICERPKIGPHVARMRARIAEIVAAPVARISVKATTTEGLGFAGRREGIAALASAALLAPALEADAGA